MKPSFPVVVRALCLSFVAGSLLAASASAAVGVCRSDPAVTLSNGVTVTLHEDISDAPSDVTQIAYQLFVPRGVTVKSVAYAGAVPPNVQSISTVASQNAGDYDAYTTVYTGTPNVPVTAYMSANSTVSCHTDGHSGQHQHSHLHLS